MPEPQTHMRQSVNGCVTCERKWSAHTPAERGAVVKLTRPAKAWVRLQIWVKQEGAPDIELDLRGRSGQLDMNSPGPDAFDDSLTFRYEKRPTSATLKMDLDHWKFRRGKPS